MKFGKLENDSLVLFKPPIKADGKEIFTNNAEILLRYGWKKVIFVQPEQREGYYAKPYYTETNKQIMQRWEYLPIPPEEIQEKLQNE